VLVVDPSGNADWLPRFAAQKKLWEWLHVIPLAARSVSPEIEPSIYLIDRLGILFDIQPLDPWNPSAIETAYVYHEARHC
jgi:hypothetical protein